MRPATLALLVLIGLSYGSIAYADNYDEGVDGDLSGNMAAPTSIALDAGSNTVTATSVSGDREYFTVNVPPGFQLSALLVVSYVSLDPIAFVAVQNGTTFTEPPTGTNPANLLGYMHFGAADVGNDILDNVGVGAGSMGFTPPLPAGDYTFWSQQTGANSSTYTLDLQMTAVPVAVPGLSGVGVLLLGIGLLLLAVRRWRQPAYGMRLRA